MSSYTGDHSEYTITQEKLRDVYDELEPLFRAHYAEYEKRHADEGIMVSPFNPRLDQYFSANDSGWLLLFVLRCEEKAVGHATMYVTNDMHNGDLIASEDTIYASKDHRNGAGRKLMLAMMEHLRSIGVKRGYVAAVTDLRVEKIWKRMGFKPLATQMVYTF